ncbi:MAG: AEC family transporter [Alphaproteobacteria bacterium]|jgi:hypothetical protein|nr:AEC family transporter [Alphaproteobacteria bacterium]MDP6814796.1 AEC family transporter [Alphaproteobacteria bacterium]
MQIVIEIVAPVFGLIACGYILARTPILTVNGARGLSAFVYYVAIPALLFRTMARGTAFGDVDFAIVYAYYAGATAVYALAMLIGRLVFRRSFAEMALMGLGGVFGNTVMLGIPLIFTAFGEAGVVPITLIVAFHSITLITAATILLEISRGHRGGIGRIVISALSALLRNPVILSLLLGFAWGWTGLAMPIVLDRFIALLVGAAAPCALAALGATLVSFRLGGNLWESVTVVGLKLLVLPLAVWLLAQWVFQLDPVWTAVATIVAAMPVGVNVFMLAEQYETYTARSASAVLISNGLAVVTLTVLLGLLAPAVGH